MVIQEVKPVRWHQVSRPRKRRHDNSYTSYRVAAKVKPPVDNDKPSKSVHLTKSLLDELGITGFISYNSGDLDNEELDGFDFPSPPSFSNNRPMCVKPVVGHSNQLSSVYQSDLINHRQPVTIFDSPEEGKRGLSELGLRLRKPEVAAARSKLNIERNHFDHLADEIILAIFAYMPKTILTKCARVCQRWRRLAYDESLWRRLDVGGKLIDSRVLGPAILSRGVEYLRLSSAEIQGDSVFEPLFLTAPTRVQYLDLSMAIVSVQALEQIISHCKQLKKLSLENLTVNNNVCRAISQNFMLTTINCSMVKGLTYSGLRHILHSCNQLEELNLAWINLPPGDVKPVVSHLPHGLRRLNMSGCRENIDDSDVKALVMASPYLQELDLSDSLGLTELCINYICQYLRLVRMLHFSRCYYITPQAFRCFQSLSLLTHLNLHSMMPEENLTEVKRTLPSVEINGQLLSTIARPTVGIYRTSIWGHRVRDVPV